MIALVIEGVLLALGSVLFLEGATAPHGFDESSGLDTSHPSFLLATACFACGGVVAFAIGRRLWTVLPAVPFMLWMAALTIW